MKASSFVRAARCAAIAGALTMIWGTAPASAACKGHFHKGSATATFRAVAGLKARNEWRGKVRAHDGSGWTYWSKAVAKTENCDKSGPGDTWYCSARARPCK
ncbi:MAG TPA: hypothetical protein VJ045_03350 [Hyphomicrobiaceae bacterium]|nr:hypothetical protein [Hyphomicrobiaceae bacterium]